MKINDSSLLMISRAQTVPVSLLQYMITHTANVMTENISSYGMRRIEESKETANDNLINGRKTMVWVTI